MSSSYQDFLKENNLKQPVMRNVTVGFSGLDPEVSLDSVTEQIENLKEQISDGGSSTPSGQSINTQIENYLNEHDFILNCAD